MAASLVQFTMSLSLCELPLDAGQCADWTMQYYFDSPLLHCRLFWYGGCGGNDNRFETMKDCRDVCYVINHNGSAVGANGLANIPPTHMRQWRSNHDILSNLSDTCLLEPQRGPCSDFSIQWYYDPTGSACDRFWYGGCQGNNNRFASEVECTSKCHVIITDQPTFTSTGNCTRSSFGCCPDGTTSAKGSNYDGCYDVDKSVESEQPCLRSQYGCCEDGVTSASGPNKKDCHQLDSANHCRQSYYGCCPGSNISASGPNHDGCSISPSTGFHPAMCRLPEDSGTCSEYTIQWRYDSAESVCRRFWYSGCGGNGNRFQTEQQCMLGCVKVDGPGNEILPSFTGGCEYTKYGCCLDGVTAASGQNFLGCLQSCLSSQYGCCEDGVTSADGFDGRGCPEEGSGSYGGCESSVYRCCQDGITAASGPDHQGCPQITPITSSTDVTDSEGVKCSGSPDQGKCADYVVQWHYDADQRECQQFWFGGCHGNANRYGTLEDCESECVNAHAPNVDFVSVCDLPKEIGTCRSQLLRWYYEPFDRQCSSFYYGGCQGNENNFNSLLECRETCVRFEHATATATTTTLRVATTTTEPVVYTFMPPPASISPSVAPYFPTDTLHRGSTELDVVCRQPKQSGMCLAYIERWYFDFDSGLCKKFVYGGCWGNSNNFGSRQDCEGYCRTDEISRSKPSVDKTDSIEDVCQLSPSPGICRDSIPRWYYDSTIRECRNFTYGGCHGNSNNFENKIDCLNYCRGVEVSKEDADFDSSVETVEKTTQKLRPTPTNDVCLQSPAPGMCTAYIQRWYYDSNQGLCRTFTYGGCHGNSNNFESESDCENNCEKRGSSRETSVVDEDDSNREPERAGVEPAFDICSLRPVVGNCKASIPRWHYDSVNQTCNVFFYGGCGGNSNNFDSQTDCLTYCITNESPQVHASETDGINSVLSKVNDVCQSSVQHGGCGQKLPRFHYSALKGRCLRFYYGGCDGNSNNFESEQTCENYCRSEDICAQARLPGPCTHQFTRYYYDSHFGNCHKFLYGGCQGNLNNFDSMAACQRKCADQKTTTVSSIDVSKAEICNLAPAGGHCDGYYINWYYDSVSKRCRRFVYSGCQGNDNRFDAEEACLDYCLNSRFIIDESPAPVASQPDLCEMPNQRGPCSDYEIFWYYDKRESICSRFYYGGCHGNENRFSSEDECLQRCAPSTQAEIVTTAPNRRRKCHHTRYGCCPNGITAAVNPYRSNCRDTEPNDGSVPQANSVVLLVNRGGVAILECQAPNGDTYWYRNGSYLESGSNFTVHSNGTLVIYDIDHSTVGNYECRIHDGNNIPHVIQYELKLKVPLSIAPSTSVVVAVFGGEAYLHCTATGCPTPSVQWYHHDSLVYSHDRTTVHRNGSLLISDVRPADVGTYQCVAENGVDAPISRNVELVTGQKFQVNIVAQNDSVMEGDTVRLSCEVLGSAFPSVSWSKDGRPLSGQLSSTKLHLRGNTLTIPDATIVDSGLYTCIAQDMNGRAEDRTYIQVHLQDHKDRCVDTVTKMKCRLIVNFNLCGHRMFSKRCCLSCRQAGKILRNRK